MGNIENSDPCHGRKEQPGEAKDHHLWAKSVSIFTASYDSEQYARNASLCRDKKAALDCLPAILKGVPMAASTAIVDAQRLLGMADDGQRYELVEGVLRMMSPAGGRHGRVAHSLGLLVGAHVRARQLGIVYAAETGFLLARDPDTVRAPDIAFVSQARAVAIDEDSGFVTVIPDLVGEVVSPRDSFSEVEEKVLGWLAAGTRLVVVVDPSTRTVHAYRRSDRVVVCREDESLDASDVVPGLMIAVADLFR